MPELTYDMVISEAVEKALQAVPPDSSPDIQNLKSDLLTAIIQQMDLENSVRAKGRAFLVPKDLGPLPIALAMEHIFHIRRVPCAGESENPDRDILAMYQTDGSYAGIYLTYDDMFRRVAREFNLSLKKKDFAEIMQILWDRAPRAVPCTDYNLIAVNNGIFDYKNKTLLPFTHEQVFLSKSRVNYNPNARNVVIHNPDDGTDWDVESWMDEISDDPEIVQLLWEIVGAVIRPHVPWNKSAWFFSETGNNGKGTLCELMRNLCGEGSCASISISDFSKDFHLESLLHATSIIVDENDVGAYIDCAAKLKSVITHEAILINRKYQKAISYRFHGFMVQCLNEFPRIRDRSDSFYRRQLFVPFPKCFTGRERKYIKSDYLHRQEVLEYVMYKVLNMNYYSLSEPKACKDVLNEYKEYNDPVRAFWDEMAGRFAWDLIPYDFAYALYKAWFRENSPSGGLQGKNTFIKDLNNIVRSIDGEWTMDPGKHLVRPQNRMDWPEPLILEYELEKWMNPVYNGGDMRKRCLPPLKASYRGLERTHPKGPPSGWNLGIALNVAADIAATE